MREGLGGCSEWADDPVEIEGTFVIEEVKEPRVSLRPIVCCLFTCRTVPKSQRSSASAEVVLEERIII